MGVKGLWNLLEPAGRRVNVETLAGRRVAVDASMWLVQFIKAMRDEQGEDDSHAHLPRQGFSLRVLDLMFEIIGFN